MQQLVEGLDPGAAGEGKVTVIWGWSLPRVGVMLPVLVYILKTLLCADPCHVDHSHPPDVLTQNETKMNSD